MRTALSGAVPSSCVELSSGLGFLLISVMYKVDASRRAEKCRSLRVKVEVGLSGCRIAGVGPALKTRPRLPPAPGLPSVQDSPPYGTLSRVKE
jgi:hypothetical protein